MSQIEEGIPRDLSWTGLSTADAVVLTEILNLPPVMSKEEVAMAGGLRLVNEVSPYDLAWLCLHYLPIEDLGEEFQQLLTSNMTKMQRASATFLSAWNSAVSVLQHKVARLPLDFYWRDELERRRKELAEYCSTMEPLLKPVEPFHQKPGAPLEFTRRKDPGFESLHDSFKIAFDCWSDVVQEWRKSIAEALRLDHEAGAFARTVGNPWHFARSTTSTEPQSSSHQGKSRSGLLDEVIERAIAHCGSDATTLVWNELAGMAEQKQPPLLGHSQSEGITYRGQIEPLNKHALANRLLRRRKRLLVPSR